MRKVTALCALPSFGAVGSPSFLGGAVAATSGSSTIDVTTLPRATTPPSSPITNNLAQQWANLATDKLVWFDGFTALYGLARATKSSSLSISYWFNPYTEETSRLTGPQKFGVIYANSVDDSTTDVNGSEPRSFRIGYTSNPPTSPLGLAVASDFPTRHQTNTPAGYPQNVGYSAAGISGFATDPIDFMQGWCHIMIGLHNVGGKPTLTIYVDETAIVTNMTLTTNIDSFGLFDESFGIPFDAADIVSPNDNKSKCPWTVGGTQYYTTAGSDVTDSAFTLPWTGDGLIGALTEVWIAPGQYVDWTSGANRAKFHNADVTNTLFAPCDIGAGGATPTGSAPKFYFTGGPDQFYINRATGKKTAVFHNTSGATLEGSVGKIQPYGIIPGQ